jgi:cytochrome c biogenesis protein CcmG/thiol:disulfide interchange protein DsbE
MKKLFLGFIVLSIALFSFGCSQAETSTDKEAVVEGVEAQASVNTSDVSLPPGMLKSDEAPIAPDFTLKNVEGGMVSLSDYKGKVVILDFWDTWCPPCKKEIPGFIELQDKYGDKGLVILGAAFGRYGEEKVAEFAKEWKMNYPVIIADQKVNRDYGGIQSIPTTFVIDTDGKARSRHVGYVEKAVFEREILALLPK